MTRRPACRLIFLLGLITAILAGCSRDPNVRKRKYLESGQRYFDKGKYREAAIQFDNAIQVDSGYGDAYYQLAKTQMQLRQWSDAYQDLTRVLELQPGNYAAHLDMANLLIAGRDFKQAQEHTTILLQQQPNNSQVHLAVASLLTAQENFSGAMVETEKAISLSPGQWEPYLSLALLQMKANQPDQAEINFKKAVELGSNKTDPSLALGGFYQSRSRYTEAEQQFRHAMEGDPKNPAPCVAMARLYMAEGKNDLAESFLKQQTPKFANNPVGYRMLGDFYFAVRELDKASSEYASLYRAHPTDIQVKKNYVQILILTNRLDDARKLDDEILKTDGSDDEALIYRGQIQTRDGHPNDAINTLRTVVKDEPGSGAAHYFLGVALNTIGDLSQAQSELQNAVRVQPDYSEAYRALASTALRQGNMSGLELAATKLIALQPNSPDGYLFRAIVEINRKQFVLDEADIRKAMDLAPQSSTAYIQMGNSRFEQRQFADARNFYQQALDRDPDSADALRGAMKVTLAQNQPDQAVSVANIQISKVPNNSVFYELLGEVLFNDKKDVGGAEAAFQKAVTLDKNNTDAFLKLGELQLANGSTDKAIATYQNALRDNPQEQRFYLLVGRLYETKQDWNEAKKMYEKALELKPADPLASNNLAYLLVQTGGNIDVALNLAQTARRGIPDSPNAADTLGWIYYQKGVFTSAIDLFREALKLSEGKHLPDNPTIHYHLALAYEKNDQPALAKQQFQRVLKIDPNYSDASEVKKQLAQL